MSRIDHPASSTVYLLAALQLLLHLTPTSIEGSNAAWRGGVKSPFKHHPLKSEQEDKKLEGAVIRVPRDFRTLEDAVYHALSKTRESLSLSKILVYLEAGSYLMKRKYKEVSVSKDGWQYYQSHAAIYLDGFKTRALVPDDGCEPKLSPNYPCRFLPTRDVRFINITDPLMLMGEPSMRTRLCGALRYHAKGTGSIRQAVCVNQQEGVIFVESGGFTMEGCDLMTSGTGFSLPDVVTIRGRKDPPSAKWAAWPPGDPDNGGGIDGVTGVPATGNPSPQGGGASFGVHASGQTKVVIAECTFRGLLCAVGAFDVTDLSLDDCLVQWNQFGVTAVDSPRLAVRRCNFTDNAYGALRVADVHAAIGTVVAAGANRVRGRLWADALRPRAENLVEDGNVVEESPAEFREGYGRHAYMPPAPPGENVISTGHWETNWTGVAGYELYEGDDGTTPDGGVSSLLERLTEADRSTRGRYRAETPFVGGSAGGVAGRDPAP